MAPLLVLVGQKRGARTSAELTGALLGLETVSYLTAEEALRRSDEQNVIIATELSLPGMSGVELVTEARRRSLPVAILTRHAPGLPPSQMGRLEGVPIIVFANEQRPLLEGLSALANVASPKSHRPLIDLVALGAEGLAPLLALIDGPGDPAVRALGIRYLAEAFEPQLALSALEARVEGAGDDLVVPALEAALSLGAFSALAKIAGATKISAPLRGRAIHAIGERFLYDAALPVLVPLLDDSSASVAGSAADAIFVASSRAAAVRSELRLHGVALETLLLLASRPGVELRVKEKSLALLAKEAPAATIGPLLSRLSASAEPTLKNLAARLLVRSDGLDADGLRVIAESEARPVDERRAALDRIAREFPEEVALPILERCMPSSTAAIAERAFELYFAAAESGWEPSLERAVAFGEGAQRAALLGALEHGRGALGALIGIAKSTFLPQLRIGAVRMLGLRYQSSEVGAVLVELLDDPTLLEAARHALLQLGDEGSAWLLRAATDESRTSVGRIAAVMTLVEAEDADRARAAASRLGKSSDATLASSAVAAVVAAGAVELSALLPRLVAGGVPALQRGAVIGAISLGDRGYAALHALATNEGILPEVRAEALAALVEGFAPGDLEGVQGPAPAAGEGVRKKRPRLTPKTDDLTIPPTADELLDRAPTKPTPPAEGPRSPIPRPVRVRSRPEPPAKPAPSAATGPTPLGPIPLSRAQDVLRECVRLGPAGLKGLRLLALSPRVPDEVRAGAVRHLAANFSDLDVGDVLVRCLEGEPLVQSTALGCLMVKKEIEDGPIARLAEDPSADLTTRLRATRFLPSRFGRSRVAPVLLRLLECGQPELERAALEGLFTSLRFTTPEAVELALINLLREHESLQVKTWAAQALGTFGTSEAIKHLDHFTGLFAEPEVKAVARRAVTRIKG